MSKSTHHVTLSDGRFLKFFTDGGDTVTCYAFKNREQWEAARGTDWHNVDCIESERAFWIKQELANLRQQVQQLENIKWLADKASDAWYEFADYPSAVAESMEHLDNAIVDYHDKFGIRWPK
ncbi:MAG TPA: hypothetical protein VFY83_04480 [Anaerolineales bacterium]|nr:hypothetical protein [Anaerolineales bacterium]